MKEIWEILKDTETVLNSKSERTPHYKELKKKLKKAIKLYQKNPEKFLEKYMEVPEDYENY